MAHEEKLPWELTEEILSRVPPNSLVRFRTVSKQWNALFDDKIFINNHKTTFRFILTAKSKIYSISIDPKIELRELTLDTPGLESQIPKNLFDSGKLLLCDMGKGVALWNPWLRQSRRIDQDLHQTEMKYSGIGHNNNGSYKILASYCRKENPTTWYWTVYDFASYAWKDLESSSGGNSQEGKLAELRTLSGVSLNGNLYWVCFYDKTDPVYLLVVFDIAREKFFKVCDLPCGTTNILEDALVLRVFEGDRVSLLKQCHATKTIEIWVTKYKINNNDIASEGVEWIKIMEVCSCDEDKRLVVCSCDETGRACIYVLEKNKLISKTQIDSVVDLWPSHCTFIPSFVPVPRGQREELAELQI